MKNRLNFFIWKRGGEEERANKFISSVLFLRISDNRRAQIFTQTAIYFEAEIKIVTSRFSDGNDKLSWWFAAIFSRQTNQ
jgi:hypothetical protein